ncbi:MAG: hypothetical protein ABIS06_17415 [Vicinamibacterales bacterium]
MRSSNATLVLRGGGGTGSSGSGVSGTATTPAAGASFIVRAIGPDGPVQDLKREELSIKTDGKQREVKAIELVAGAAAAAPSAVASEGSRP